jgi:predicted RNase H-like HicB family nuclease
VQIDRIEQGLLRKGQVEAAPGLETGVKAGGKMEKFNRHLFCCNPSLLGYNLRRKEVDAMGYMARYTKISSGYMGQLVEWPEVVTEGKTLDECRTMLRDALREMLLAYDEQGKPVPLGADLIEPLAVEACHVGQPA